MFHIIFNLLVLMIYLSNPQSIGGYMIVTGYAMNGIEIVANNGKMPVFYKGITEQELKQLDEIGIMTVGNKATKLPFLSDCIKIDDLIVSPGDILIALGCMKNLLGNDMKIIISSTGIGFEYLF